MSALSRKRLFLQPLGDRSCINKAEIYRTLGIKTEWISKSYTVSTILLRGFVSGQLLTQKEKLTLAFSRIPEKRFGVSYV
jgi:hypothetical protein